MALTSSRVDKSHATFIPKSRQDATDGKIQSSIRYSVPDIIQMMELYQYSL